MIYLTVLSLKYAINMCLSKPKYVVYIAVLDDISIKKTFYYLLGKITDDSISGKGFTNTFGEIDFRNGSYIRVIDASTTAKYIRCHLLIVDNKIDIDTKEKLRAFEIRDYDKEKELEEKFSEETKGEQLMNIVQVNFINGIAQRRYTYKVPNGISLKKGDIVRVRNKDGKEAIAVCVTDSENLSDNAVDMIMGGLDVLSNVVGVYNLVKFQDVTNYIKFQERTNE